MTPKKHSSQLTSSSTPGQSAKASSSGPRSHNYLLVKNLAGGVSDKSLQELLPIKLPFEEVIRIPDSSNVYVSFRSLAEVKRVVEESETRPVSFQGKQLKMCLVNKLPLDLNINSRILLLTIYHEKVAINTGVLLSLFQHYGPIIKMIVFRKKNFQAFVEFESTDDASFFKQALNGQSIMGYFTLKIQFTQKQGLVVAGNTEFEFDCSGFITPGTKPQPLEPMNLKFPASPIFASPGEGSRSPGSDGREKRSSPKKAQLSIQRLLFDEEEDGGRLEQAFFCPSESEDEAPSGPVRAPTSKFSPLQATSASFRPQVEKSSVVRLEGVGSEVRHKHLFNLFSLYGTIERISLDTKGEALIKFSTEFEAIAALYYLNHISLFGRSVELRLLEEASVWPKSTTHEYSLKAPSDPHGKQRTISRPSATLYVFNLSKNTNLSLLKQLFETKEPVLSLEYLNESKNSALCVFKTVEAAIRVLCCFKNVNLLDKCLKVNFANELLTKARKKSDSPVLSHSEEDGF